MRIRMAVAWAIWLLVTAGASAQQADRAGQTPAQTEAGQPPARGQDGQPPASFEELFRQWKELLGRLRQIQEEYRIAKPAERERLEKEFNELLAQGEAMAPRLKRAAEASFKANPQNKEVGAFLAAAANDAFRRDNYEEALRLARVLLENGFENRELANIAGVSAFAVADYDAAEKYLTQAGEQGTLSQEGEMYLAQLDDYRKYWQREQELRKAEAQADNLPRVLLKTTEGDIVVELFEDQAPNTVANFISLVEKDFYDGVAFHRVIAGFMAQGGDPQGDGSGGPGYTIPDETNRDDYRIHFRGSLSMAKTAAPDSGGSQFFITFRPTPHLNRQHTVFGRVVQGMEVLSKLQRRTPEPGQPEPDKIVDAKVLRKRPHEYQPKTLAEK